MHEEVKKKNRKSVTPPGFEMVLYIRYNRTKTSNSTITFWVVAYPQEVKKIKRAKDKSSSKMSSSLGKQGVTVGIRANHQPKL